MNTRPPGETLEQRVSRLEKVFKIVKPIHIDTDGKLEQIDFNNPP